MWGLDGSLWAHGAKARAVCMNRLGWLRAPDVFRNRVAEMYAFAEGVRQDGIRNVVLCGMGGSSLAPEVLAGVFGARTGFPRLLVLDSTDPEAIAAVEQRVDVASSLFLISSKSGTTIETDCLAAHFWSRATARSRTDDAGRHFAAITDPGSQLALRAEADGWRAVFENPPDIGGRYSALSFFGLVPAALLGLDVERLLASAEREAASCRPDAVPEECDAMRLGVAMGRLAQDGVDKLTVRCSPGLAPFGAWVEQLVAESTGKAGQGIVPVVDEPPGARHAHDRFYVDLLLSRDRGASPAALTRSDAPQVVFRVRDPYDLGALFYRFEMATALAGAVLGVNPFDEPNVSEAKEATAAVLRGGEAPPVTVLAQAGALSVSAPSSLAEALRVGLEGPMASPASWLRAHLERSAAGDYVAILAYVAATAARVSLLQEIRVASSVRAGAPATLGFGPRYLHSTGQLHKGGAANGIFLILEPDATSGAAPDLPIPGQPFTFARLFHAQAEGDFRTLAHRGRRVLRVRLTRPVEESLAALRDALRGR